MTEGMDNRELKERLDLIENMIAVGRHTTQRWAWSFVLWGVAYYVAFAWASWGQVNWLAWPVTMVAAAVVTGVVGVRIKRDHPGTTVGRAISSIWAAMGITVFALLMAISISGRYEPHTSVAIVGAMLGLANGASGMILRWKMQLACAIVWLGAGVAACFASETQVMVLFLAAIFFCQIVFGVYGIICESRRRQRRAVHA